VSSPLGDYHHNNDGMTSPFVLSQRVGVANFIVINQEYMTPLSENASIESETPRSFQVDILYKIDATKVPSYMVGGVSWPPIKLGYPSLLY